MGGVPVLIVSSAKRQTKKLIFATNCLDFISVHLFGKLATYYLNKMISFIDLLSCKLHNV